MYELITNGPEEKMPEVEVAQTLDELARAGARRMIAEALELGAEEYVQKMHHLRD